MNGASARFGPSAGRCSGNLFSLMAQLNSGINPTKKTVVLKQCNWKNFFLQKHFRFVHGTICSAQVSISMAKRAPRGWRPPRPKAKSPRKKSIAIIRLLASITIFSRSINSIRLLEDRPRLSITVRLTNTSITPLSRIWVRWNKCLPTDVCLLNYLGV